MAKWFVVNIVLVGLLLFGCTSNMMRLTLNIPDFRSEEVSLSYDKQEFVSSVDSSGVVQFDFNVSTVSYCVVNLKNLQLRCYVEPNKELVIDYLSHIDPQTGSRFRFRGDLQEENTLLNSNCFYKPFRMQVSAQTEIEKVWENLMRLMEINIQRLDSVTRQKMYSARFLELEKQRIRYATLGLYNRCKKWSPKIYSYVEPLLIVDESLFGLKEYLDFLRNGVYVLGYRGLVEITPLNHVRNQINYIMQHLSEGDIRSYLLEEIVVDYIMTYGVDDANDLIALIGDDFLEKTVRLKRVYEEWGRLRQGAVIPDFVFTDRDGNSVSFERFKGKYVFIDCWASWCSPCRAEIPYLRKLEEMFENKDVVFVGISTDNNRDKWLEALESLDLHGEQWLEENGTVFSNFFKVTSIPRFILLNPEGRIERCVMTRPSDPETLDILNDLI